MWKRIRGRLRVGLSWGIFCLSTLGHATSLPLDDELARMPEEIRLMIADLLVFPDETSGWARETGQFVRRHKSGIKTFLSRDFEQLLQHPNEGQLTQTLRDLRQQLLKGERVAQPKSFADLMKNLWLPLREEILKFSVDLLKELQVQARFNNFRKNPNAFAQSFQQKLSRFLEKKVQQWAETLQSEMQTSLKNFRISQSPEFQELLDPVHGLNVPDRNLNELLRAFLPKYYDGLSVERKKGILRRMLQADPKEGLAPRLAALIEESGPLVQKLFQMVARDADSALVRDALAILQSRAKPLDQATFEKQVKAELGASWHEEVTAIGEKELGTGSVAETRSATLTKTKRPIVLKVLKPGVREAMQEDLHLIRSFLPQHLRGLAQRYADSALRELDLIHEAQNIALSALATEGNPRVGVAHLAADIQPRSGLIAIEKLSGKPLHSVSDPLERGKIAEQALEQLLEAIFRNEKPSTEALKEFRRTYVPLFGKEKVEELMTQVLGFFHGDPHAGNLFQSSYGFDYIDHGHVGSLNWDQKKGIVKLLLTLRLDPEKKYRAKGLSTRILEAVELISGHPISNALKLQLKPTLVNILRTPDLSEMEKISLIIQRFEEVGFELPEVFLSLDRALKMVVAEIREANRLLKTQRRSPRFSEENVVRRVFEKRVFQSLNPLPYFGWGARSVLDAQDIEDAIEIRFHESAQGRKPATTPSTQIQACERAWKRAGF